MSIDFIIYSKSVASKIVIMQIFISSSIRLYAIAYSKKEDSTINFHIYRHIFFLSQLLTFKQVINVTKFKS